MKEWAYPKLKEEYCTLPNTGDQQHRECHLTKMQTFDLMTEMVRNIDDREKLISTILSAGQQTIPAPRNSLFH